MAIEADLQWISETARKLIELEPMSIEAAVIAVQLNMIGVRLHEIERGLKDED